MTTAADSSSDARRPSHPQPITATRSPQAPFASSSAKPRAFTKAPDRIAGAPRGLDHAGAVGGAQDDRRTGFYLRGLDLRRRVSPIEAAHFPAAARRCGSPRRRAAASTMEATGTTRAPFFTRTGIVVLARNAS